MDYLSRRYHSYTKKLAALSLRVLLSLKASLNRTLSVYGNSLDRTLSVYGNSLDRTLRVYGNSLDLHCLSNYMF